MNPIRHTEAMERMIGVRTPVLNHGFVELIDYMGTDAAVTTAARQSTGGHMKSEAEDAGLIRYLMRQRHTSPFEMCEIKLLVRLPIFVARQWIRHRTANVNEFSARYSELPTEFYMPDVENVKTQGTFNHQGSGDAMNADQAEAWLDSLEDTCNDAFAVYQEGLADGVARETARMGLPVNAYTQWVWKIDLHNLLHFLSLRLHAHAQAEIRAYASVIADLVARWAPLTWDAFVHYRLGAHTFSLDAMNALRLLLADTKAIQIAAYLQENNVKGGELRETMLALGCAQDEIDTVTTKLKDAA